MVFSLPDPLIFSFFSDPPPLPFSLSPSVSDPYVVDVSRPMALAYSPLVQSLFLLLILRKKKFPLDRGCGDQYSLAYFLIFGFLRYSLNS